MPIPTDPSAKPRPIVISSEARNLVRRNGISQQHNRESPLVIVWRVTEQCNLACQFCGYSRQLQRPRRTTDPDVVLPFGRILGDYAQTHHRSVLVSWLGGEPFLWKPIFDVTQQLKSEFGLLVSATTNGVALKSPEVRERVVDAFDEITISIDGMGVYHDRVRGQVGLFYELRNSIKALHARKLEQNSNLLIRANTILMRDQIRAFETLCAELANWGVTELSFNTLGGDGERPSFFPHHRLLPEDVEWFRQALPGIRSRLRERNFRIVGSGAYLEQIARFARGQACAVADCLPGQHYLFADENSTIAPCHLTTTGYGIPIAQLQSVEDFAALPSIFAGRRDKGRLASCMDCQSTHVFGKFSAPSFEMERIA